MAVIISWKDNAILKCSNSIFSGIYEDILDIIYEKKLIFNESLTTLINRLELCGDGWNIDLAEYISKKKDLDLFVNLVRKGIDRHYKEIPELPQITKDRLENFYQGLLEAQKDFLN